MKKADEAKEVGGEKDKNKSSTKTTSDPLVLFSKRERVRGRLDNDRPTEDGLARNSSNSN